MDLGVKKAVSYMSQADLPPSDRYRDVRFLVTDGDKVFRKTRYRRTIPESNLDRVHLVESGEKDRLDLISNKYYGTPIYFWIIAEASGIANPLNVPEGTELRIPPIESILGS